MRTNSRELLVYGRADTLDDLLLEFYFTPGNGKKGGNLWFEKPGEPEGYYYWYTTLWEVYERIQHVTGHQVCGEDVSMMQGRLPEFEARAYNTLPTNHNS